MPVSLTPEVIDLPIGAAALVDAAWVDGVTVVALSRHRRHDDRSTRSSSAARACRLGTPVNGVAIVGGNGLEGTRVLDADGEVLRPGGGSSWQSTGLVASFLATQQ